MKQCACLLALWLVGLAPSLALAEPFWTKVVSVQSGDHLTVLHDKKKLPLRLFGVRAPQPEQPWGKQARELTTKLVSGRTIQLELVKKDPDGCQVAKVDYPAKIHRLPLDKSKPGQLVTVWRSLPEALLQAGLARWQSQEAPLDKKLARVEAAARQAQRGLWTGGRFKVSGLFTKLPPAPQYLPSKDRACKTDADCTFLPQGGCGCPPCGPTWRIPANRAHAKWLAGELAIESCPPMECPRCNQPVIWLGTKSLCQKGQCVVLGGVVKREAR